MHLGKGQDYFLDEFALGRFQLQEGVKGFAFEITDTVVPALLLGAQMRLHMIAITQALKVHLQQPGEFLHFFLRRDGFAVEPLPYRLEPYRFAQPVRMKRTHQHRAGGFHIWAFMAVRKRSLNRRNGGMRV